MLPGLLRQSLEKHLGQSIPAELGPLLEAKGFVERWENAGSGHARRKIMAEAADELRLLDRHLGVLSGLRLAKPPVHDEGEGWSEGGPAWPNHGEPTPGAEAYLTHVGGRRRVASQSFEDPRVPEEWRRLSRELLREYQSEQRKVLAELGRISRHKMTMLHTRLRESSYRRKWERACAEAQAQGAAEPPWSPPGGQAAADHLGPEEFLRAEHLEPCLLDLRDRQLEQGEIDYLRYRDAQGVVKSLEFRWGFARVELPAWGLPANPLYSIKEGAERLWGEVGLPEEDAVSFLACNADVVLPWLGFSIRLDNSLRGPSLVFRVGTPLVPASLVRYWYERARGYALAQLWNPNNYRGGIAFEQSFKSWLGQSDAEDPKRLKEALLVSFVEEGLQHRAPWPDIWEKWKEFMPLVAYRSPGVMQRAFYRARRKVCERT